MNGINLSGLSLYRVGNAMILVPWLLTDSGMILSRSEARVVEDNPAHLLKKIIEYCLVPTYRVSVGRTTDDKGVQIYRCTLDRVPLEPDQEIPEVTIQYDLYSTDSEELRARFYEPDITDAELEESFKLVEPIREDGTTFPSRRFTRAFASHSQVVGPQGEKQLGSGIETLSLGIYRIIGLFPDDMVPLAIHIADMAIENTTIVFFDGIIEIQHPDVGTFTMTTSKGGERIEGDADEDQFYSILSRYYPKGITTPPFRILKSGTTSTR